MFGRDERALGGLVEYRGFNRMMKETTQLLKASPLVLLAACATFRGMGEDFQNLGKGMEKTVSEYESKNSPAPSSSQNQASAKSGSFYSEPQTVEIRKAQERLSIKGFDPGPVDGFLGPQTQAALQQYQAAHGLPATGVLDEKTQNTLGVKTDPKLVGYEEFGKASYYAIKYQFRKTASGERFNQFALTAAHRKLPFGTKVLVTNVKNGKSVEVKINDRGPFVKGRIIDLTRSAFSKIGDLDSGVIEVKIKAIK